MNVYPLKRFVILVFIVSVVVLFSFNQYIVKMISFYASHTDVTAYVARRRRDRAAATGCINLVAILKLTHELNPAGVFSFTVGFELYFFTRCFFLFEKLPLKNCFVYIVVILF
jgi:hypothetical protein